MDADGRIIPIVEDDQGEGFKDEIDPENIDPFIKAVEELRLKKDFIEAKKTLMDTPRKQGLLKIDGPSQYLEPSDQPQSQPQRMKMELGMPINFYGYQYKVVRIMNRGRIMLKLQGEIPEGK